MDAFKQAIAKRFKMKDLGQLRWILGMEVIRDRMRCTLEIRQTAYFKQMLARVHMEESHPLPTPIHKGNDLNSPDDNDGDVDHHEYMSIVGSLLYAAMVTRPGIAYAVQVLSKHMQAPGKEHVEAAKRVLRYIRGTIYRGIKYGADRAHDGKLVGFCDADWAGDWFGARGTGRSTTGYVFQMGGGSVSWASKLQQTVALSSTEAEYMALCAGVQEAIHLRQLLDDLGYSRKEPTTIFEDNKGAIVHNPVRHARTKHIATRYHFTRERVVVGDVVVVHIRTEHQLADILTKAIDRNRLEALRNHVLGYRDE